MSKSRGNKIAEDAPFKRRPYRSVIPRLSCLRLAPSDPLVCLARLSGPFSVSRRSVKRYLRSAIRTRKQKNHPDRKKSCKTLKTNKSSRQKIRRNPHPHHRTPHPPRRTHQAPNIPKTPAKPANADQTRPKPDSQNAKQKTRIRDAVSRTTAERNRPNPDQGACPLRDRRARMAEGRAKPSRARCSPRRPGA